ncbi:MAG: adenosylmethionine--8-amino-7-oxononanoate transaminase [Nitrosopumilaceae archaeon]|nr:adenosylmethionine--8-amino-7-oxononanoate transaminase [Nitrosopumilaceae archaeon]NIU02580.1 adenosylmethionine--8-amino-7-oxononanoate transaminase [Nitrosopumilaceae archaeon]NIU89046.1 adenosylmethionine--8-amino-7-oxononanoate transaminase [Nitrosopumilaceae archaeon]NIV67150.1 adenosylmethionine--8-amino-7-oxononanoate transaminase [Nitrosopumilaceae archaeon]NIX63181.1 adenosylmethionine--8-amino-7-oxononanoate transaminase [Nitrosopumilaceae archaeon]
MSQNSSVWHPNSQMREWKGFDKIVRGNGVYLVDSKGNKLLDGVGSMWCNVWGHSNKELQQTISKQSKKISHSPLFNLTNEPAEQLAKKLVRISPGMNKVFFSDNGSSAMEIAVKIAIQYWNNLGYKDKTRLATLENGYHGDTFGSMSVGYIPQFFSKFKTQLFSVKRFPVPNSYRIPKGYTFNDYQNFCLDEIEKYFSENDKLAAFVMESGAQLAGGVIIYPEGFQKKIDDLCKKYGVLFVVDEIATGFGRLGSMIQYSKQNCRPDIVAYGKMLTGGYITLATTLVTKKIYQSFLSDFYEYKHLFHGHTFTGNPLAASVANHNLNMYQKYRLIQKIQKTSQVFKKFYEEIKMLDLVGDIRHKGMLMGIELVSDKREKTPIKFQKSTNKIIFEEGKKNGIYLRTLGNIVMLVPPLIISEKELGLLLKKTVTTIKNIKKFR